MTRNLFIFLGTFVAGALIALVARAAMFKPNAGHEGHPAGGVEYSAMVSNPLTPAKSEGANTADTVVPAAPAKASATNEHANHGAMSAAPAAGKVVNTVCVICGMDVDPKLPTAQYQGKTIGFGCKMCPPKFKAEPDRYGPYYLRNEVIKK